jgi:hypothetical protein
VKKLLFAVFVPVAVCAARPARADTNFDLNFQTGIGRRFLSSPSGEGGLAGSWDPMLLVEADVALAPLLRLGLYVDEEIAVDGEPRAPFMTGFGGRFRFTPPGLNTEKFKFWVFAGLGFTGVVAPGYTQNLPFQTPTGENGGTAPIPANVQSANGYFIEVPFGIGGSYRLRGNWSFVCELSGRAALDSSGEYFDPTGRTATAVGTTGAQQAGAGIVIGSESVGIFLTAGVGLDL